MKRTFFTLALILIVSTSAYGRGLLIPVEPDLPPLAMLNHRVTVALEEQATVTRVEQTFRNHTDRKLEATYVFPVPEGASVRELIMWVDGKRVKGELLKADDARRAYESIVKQTKEPGLLQYIGSDLLRLKIYPVPPQGDQKVEVSFTSIAKKEHDIVEYIYPLESERGAASTLQEFTINIDLQSQQAIGGIYSPTHDLDITRVDDHHATVKYERHQASLDRDFKLYYTTTGEEIGLTALQHRPISDEAGYAMLLLSPRKELQDVKKTPRDVVFVLDTSGSMMKDKKMDQAKRAVRRCLDDLDENDRFGLISFATTVNPYRAGLTPARGDHLKRAKGWVADQYAGGGTAIHGALTSALKMRTDETGRMFTVVFFTDGQPTIGETNTETISRDILAKNSENTRIFCLGVGNDLNAVFLDQMAEQTRALSQYVRPEEDLEGKVASFFGKINKPVLTNLVLTTDEGIRLTEVYPPQLPDLFYGDQLVVLARYDGAGDAKVKLQGQVGDHVKDFTYPLEFQPQTEEKRFVEELWARRKVGFLLDQIRINGEKSELVDEVVRLAKAYGITTPYTSYLIMPDAPLDLAMTGNLPGYVAGRMQRAASPLALAKNDATEEQEKVTDFARRIQRERGDFAGNRGRFQDDAFADLDKLAQSEPSASRPTGGPAGDAGGGFGARDEIRSKLEEAKRRKESLDLAYSNYQNGQWRANQVQELGVDLAVATNHLKVQSQLTATAVNCVASRNCVEIGGVWIDEEFDAKTPTLAVKAQSNAYFRILQRQPQMKEVFKLSNHIVWKAPNGMALVIDTTDGKEELSDREIDQLFLVKR